MQKNERQEQVPTASGQSESGSPASRTGPCATGASHEDGVTIDFDEISRGSKRVQIRFRGQVYQLRTTRNGKLILNK